MRYVLEPGKVFVGQCRVPVGFPFLFGLLESGGCYGSGHGILRFSTYRGGTMCVWGAFIVFSSTYVLSNCSSLASSAVLRGPSTKQDPRLAPNCCRKRYMSLSLGGIGQYSSGMFF